MGVSQQIVQRMERGRASNPTFRMLDQWAHALGLEPRVEFRPSRGIRPPLFPRSLRKYFWEIAPSALDPTAHAGYVVERLLEYGGLPALRWLRRAYPIPFIRTVAKTSRRLSPRARNMVRYL